MYIYMYVCVCIAYIDTVVNKCANKQYKPR